MTLPETFFSIPPPPFMLVWQLTHLSCPWMQENIEHWFLQKTILVCWCQLSGIASTVFASLPHLSTVGCSAWQRVCDKRKLLYKVFRLLNTSIVLPTENNFGLYGEHNLSITVLPTNLSWIHQMRPFQIHKKKTHWIQFKCAATSIEQVKTGVQFSSLQVQQINFWSQRPIGYDIVVLQQEVRIFDIELSKARHGSIASSTSSSRSGPAWQKTCLYPATTPILTRLTLLVLWTDMTTSTMLYVGSLHYTGHRRKRSHVPHSGTAWNLPPPIAVVLLLAPCTQSRGFKRSPLSCPNP